MGRVSMLPAGTGRRSSLSLVPLGCAQLMVQTDGPLIEVRHSLGMPGSLLLSAIEARALAHALLYAANVAEGGER